MNANYSKNPTIEEAVKKIENVYKDVLDKEIVRAVALGGFAVWEILYDNYIMAIDNADSEIDKNVEIEELINKIRREGQIVKERKRKAQEEIEKGKDVIE